MSDTTPTCASCEANTVAQWGMTCTPCMTSILQRKQAQQPARTAQVTLVWETVVEDKGKLSPGYRSAFSKKIAVDAAADAAMRILGDKHQGTDGSGVGVQATYVENGTFSVDYQGTRDGSNGSKWIDIQGQIGSSASSRTSVFQLLVQAHDTATPPRDRIRAAIDTGFDAQRRVIRYDNQSLPR